MSWDTFQAAIKHESDYVMLGGGEPLLHPDFERFIFHALARTEGVFIVTNGSQTDRAIVLANLARRGVLGAALSLDPWHDPIDPRVVDAFTSNLDRKFTIFGRSDNSDCREIRDVSKNNKGVMRVGRAVRRSFQQNWKTHENCACCGDPVVDPNGDVRQCGCPKSPIVGNVFDGFQSLVDDYGDEWNCYKRNFLLTNSTFQGKVHPC